MSLRPIAEIELDFANLLVSRLPVAIARDKFERLWDEANAVAGQLVLTSQVTPYLALLQRMHDAFESRYAQRRMTNGNAVRRPNAHRPYAPCTKRRAASPRT